MNGWRDGGMDRGMEEWMDDGWMDELMEKWMGRQKIRDVEITMLDK